MSVIRRLQNRFWQFGGVNLVREYIRLGVFGEFVKQGLSVLLRRKSINEAYSCIQQKVVPQIRKKYAPLLQQLLLDYSGKELTHQHSHIVWVCWFQGMEHAPEIVRICHTSLRRYITDREIIVLTDDNISQYVTFPEHIRMKYQKGLIPMAHYSDLLRLEVLTRYGGTWIDSTVLCTGCNLNVDVNLDVDLDDNLDDNLNDNLNVDVNLDDNLNHNLNDNLDDNVDYLDADLFLFQSFREGDAGIRGISNWFITASSNQKILLILKEMLYQYHKDYHCTVAYFFFHIFFMMIAKELPEEVRKMPRVSNQYCFQLEHHLGDRYDEMWMKNLTDRCCFHKLNGRLWKEAEGKRDTYLCRIKEMFRV